MALQKQSGLSSLLRERLKTAASYSGAHSLPFRESFCFEDLKEPYGELFNQICRPKSWEGVTNTCLSLVGKGNLIQIQIEKSIFNHPFGGQGFFKVKRNRKM